MQLLAVRRRTHRSASRQKKRVANVDHAKSRALSSNVYLVLKKQVCVTSLIPSRAFVVSGAERASAMRPRMVNHSRRRRISRTCPQDSPADPRDESSRFRHIILVGLAEPLDQLAFFLRCASRQQCQDNEAA